MKNEPKQLEPEDEDVVSDNYDDHDFEQDESHSFANRYEEATDLLLSSFAKQTEDYLD